MSQLRLEQSLPLELSSLSAKDRGLFDRLPGDYRDFLSRSNGGFVTGGSMATFDIPIERRREGEVVSTVCQSQVEEFFAFIPAATRYSRQYGKVPASVLHEHWGRHQAEEFLPTDVVVFASCLQNCLLAISLNSDDFGAVYYWEWYWRYPWFSQFFDERIDKARSRFDNVEQILDDPSNPLYQEAFNALNYATLVKVADSFSGFVASLRSADDPDA
jgi:hypothetical protein